MPSLQLTALVAPFWQDILGLFIKAAEEENDTKVYDDKYLSDIVLNLIIAGRDTTACLLSWTFYLLARHPQVKSILDSEIEKADANQYDSMKHMPYLTAVFYETARLYPPVPMDGKV